MTRFEYIMKAFKNIGFKKIKKDEIISMLYQCVCSDCPLQNCCEDRYVCGKENTWLNCKKNLNEYLNEEMDSTNEA